MVRRRNIKWIIVFVAIAAAIGVWIFANNRPSRLDGLAQCLKDKNAVFYGAFWCPHCQNQKRLFGRSAKLLPYVECSTPDGRSQTAICVEKKIEGYPTWEFADGSKINGEATLAQLGEKTGCTIPSEK